MTTSEDPKSEIIPLTEVAENKETMFWQSVEELEKIKQDRRTRKESKEERMKRQGQQALHNIELSKI